MARKFRKNETKTEYVLLLKLMPGATFTKCLDDAAKLQEQVLIARSMRDHAKIIEIGWKQNVVATFEVSIQCLVTLVQQNKVTAEVPPISKLYYPFDSNVINAIADSSTNIILQIGFDSQPRYSTILRSGLKFPLSINSHVYNFVDITLADIVQITSGENSMIALTRHGDVYGQGFNFDGELALGDSKARKEWAKIEGFTSPVKQVAYNRTHALFLTVEGNVFSCGDNNDGQLV